MKTILIVSSFFLFAFAHAQDSTWCITNYMDSIEVAKNPGIKAEREKLEEFTQKFQDPNPKTVLIIPVVFHIVHNYGEENISKEIVEAGIEEMNKDYRKLNTGLSSVVSNFIPIIADMEIEFRLATKDPNGNCTEGITRTQSMSTYNATNDVKYDVPGWNPSSYLNIWIVHSIEGSAAAWSHYPGISPDLDGVVCIYHYVGRNHVLTHEVGHYLNLRHTWGNSNDPGLSENCYDDDLVNDTPNTIGTTNNACNLSQTTCGSLDNVQNYMDYSGCPLMYTEGQKTRARAALNSSISGRNNLWTSQNLILTGTNSGYEAPDCTPIADFSTSKSTGCQGFTAVFSDLSYNGPVSSREWQFAGASPSFSTLQNPEVFYNQPGDHQVSLTVYNTAGNNVKTCQAFIHVRDTIAGLTAPVFVEMQDAAFPDYTSNPELKWVIGGTASNKWTKYSHSNGNKSLRVKNFSNQTNAVSEIISPNISFNSSISMSKLSFQLAYAKKSSSSNDELRVYYSNDCGNTWKRKYTKSAGALSTNGNVVVSGEFIPTDNQWRTENVNLGTISGLSHLMLKFELISRNGNYLYIDDIKLGEYTSIEEDFYHNGGANFTIQPMPVDKNSTIEFVLTRENLASFVLYDYSGNRIGQVEIKANAGENKVSWNRLFPETKPGIYFVHCQSNKSRAILKAVVF